VGHPGPALRHPERLSSGFLLLCHVRQAGAPEIPSDEVRDPAVDGDYCRDCRVPLSHSVASEFALGSGCEAVRQSVDAVPGIRSHRRHLRRLPMDPVSRRIHFFGPLGRGWRSPVRVAGFPGSSGDAATVWLATVSRAGQRASELTPE